MHSRLTFKFWKIGLPACLVALGVAAEAQAASPVYWANRVDFDASLTESVTDTYDGGGYVTFMSYTDAAMTAVLGETEYHTTGFANSNYISMDSDNIYCGGCTSFELIFTSTSVGDEEGVNAVGFDVIYTDDFFQPYWAYITFADGTTESVDLPGQGFFWGVSAPEKIERIHFGLMNGGATMNGYLYIDDLTIGQQLCGNGVLDPDEECDDGDETVDCDSNCTFVSCGDGDSNQAAGEDCDTAGDSINCDFDCSFVECGDEYINAAANELCDDGSQTETVECDNDCTPSLCGDGVFNLTAGESCDDAGDSADCNLDCTVAACGDGYLNEAADEVCDESVDTATCDGDCTPVECGDGYLNSAIGEICDDAEGSATCDVDCTEPECGDGLSNELAGEECDGDGKGMPGETAVCDLDCTEARCGDGVQNVAREEECDDGNLSDGDGCASFCIIEDFDSTGVGSESGEPSSSEESGVEPSTGDESSTSSQVSDSTTGTVDTDGATDTDTDGPSAAGDSGCGCSSQQPAQGGQGGLLALGLLVLGAIRRRNATR
jgi:MYXO-CTERM domain-containing protein